jgi:putative holliday junction resolvase
MNDGAASPPRTPQITLAFDFGSHRIGIASGDTLTRMARPAKTLSARPAIPWADIATLIADYTPSQLVVGVPYNMDGTETLGTRACREFARQLEQRFRLPVALIDERQSSREAEHELRRARSQGLKVRRITHGDVDMMAAKVILERWYAEEAGKTKERH